MKRMRSCSTRASTSFAVSSGAVLIAAERYLF
jgi:hypothetical protein